MKKRILILFLMLLIVFKTFAKGENTIYVYGVDYTSVKVFGANETEEQFAKAFVGINNLLLKEPEKFNFRKLLGTENQLMLQMVIDLTNASAFSDIKTYDKTNETLNIVEKVKQYDIKEEQGIGLIIIGKLLDKSLSKATYKVVLFDLATRNIIDEGEFTAKAKGFGLRNFWASTIYKLTKKFKFNKTKK